MSSVFVNTGQAKFEPTVTTNTTSTSITAHASSTCSSMAHDAKVGEAPQDTTSVTIESTSNKKKRSRPSKNLTIAHFSVRDPTWTYLHLKHISSTTTASTIDETTVSLWIDAALGQFLGMHGRAIPVDHLKLRGQDIYIRVPYQDHQAFIASLTNWTGRNGDALRTVGWSSWDATAYGRDAGQDLFTD